MTTFRYANLEFTQNDMFRNNMSEMCLSHVGETCYVSTAASLTKHLL